MELCRALDEAIQTYLRTASFPVAVQILDDESRLPPNARRPLRDMGCRMNLCQGISLARRYGWVMGFGREDHACSNSLVIMGLVEVPEFLKNGSIVAGPYTDTLEHGAVTQAVTPRSDRPLRAFLLAPLHKAGFTPDVVLVYCSPGQAVRLVQADLYTTGGNLESKFMGRCACGSEIVTTLQTGRCQLVVPGGGEKVFAMTADDEMVFTIPEARIQAVMDGLAGTHKAGANRFPAPFFGIKAAPEFPPVYAELEKYVGLRE